MIISRPGSDFRQRAQTGRLSWGQKGACACLLLATLATLATLQCPGSRRALARCYTATLATLATLQCPGGRWVLALACYGPKWVPLYELMKQRVLCRSSFADRGPKTAETAIKTGVDWGGYRLHSRRRHGICQEPYTDMWSKKKKIDQKNE